MKIVWMRNAKRQLDEIYDFLEQQSPAAAVKFYNGFIDEVAKLADFPEMAPIETLLDNRQERFRSLVVGRTHKAIYFIDDEAVNVVAVWDCRQNPETLKEKTTKQQ